MRKLNNYLLFSFLLINFFSLLLYAEIPDAVKNDPLFKLGYLNVNGYPGVKNNGSGDCAPGIQQAIHDACEYKMAVFFPLGTYTISDTLKLYKWLFWNAQRKTAWAGPEENWKYSHFMAGEEKDGKRPVIKLSARAYGFDDPAKPKPAIKFGGFVGINENATRAADLKSFHPMDAPENFRKDSSFSFYQEIKNIDIDISGHAGAIGLSFSAAQYSSIINVHITAQGAYLGFDGMPGRNSGAVNISVLGGQTGIRIGASSGVTIAGARLIGQETAALENTDFVPLMLLGTYIKKEKAPAIKLLGTKALDQKVTANCSISFIDGVLELNDQGCAVDNQAGSGLFLKNIYIQGTDLLVQSGSLLAVKGQGRLNVIKEYTYTQPFNGNRTIYCNKTWNIINGALNDNEEPLTAVQAAEKIPADIISRHLYNFPSFSGTDNETAVVTEQPFAANGFDENDDTDALQKAIDSASAGHGRVYLPAGVYYISRTLTLHSNTVLFGTGLKLSIIKTHSSWKPEKPVYMIQTADDKNAATFLGFLCLLQVTRQWAFGENSEQLDPYDNFSTLLWRAGRKSASINIMVHDEPWVRGTPTTGRKAFHLTGSAGGRHYFVCPGMKNEGNKDFRSLFAENTSEPMLFYGLNVEGYKSPGKWRTAGWEAYQANAEFINCRNIRIFGIKREGEAASVILRNCSNFGFYSSGGMRECVYKGCGGYVQIYGKSFNLEMANLLVQFGKDDRINGEALFNESIDSQKPVQIIYPEGLGLYKRGSADDSQIFK